MADWNLSASEQAKLERVARDEALLTQEAHSYLPTTPEEAERFNPHEWVLEAMRRAYSMGRTAGRIEARADVRRALGL